MTSWLRLSTFMFIGIQQFSSCGYEQKAKHFDNSILERSFEGKLCVVTGANKGIGFQTSEEFAKRGCILHMVCRDSYRGKQAVEKIVQKTGNKNILLKVCDVSNIENIKDLVAEYEKANEKIHVLVNNAGVLLNSWQSSKEGLEMSFATNTLGPFVLTYLLKGLLTKSAPSKVIFVSSGGMYTQHLETEDLEAKQMKPFQGEQQYSRDKRRQVALCEKFCQEWKNSGVGIYSMHPGWTETEGLLSALPGFSKIMGSKYRNLQQGADTIVFLALQDNEKLEQGAFYLDREPQAKHLPLSNTQYRTEFVDELWHKLIQIGNLNLQRQ